MPSKATKAKRPVTKASAKTKARAKSKKSLNLGIMSGFSKKARMITFVLLFANIATIGMLIANAATAGLSYKQESDQFSRINNYRKNSGKTALGRSACLSGIARSWAMHMGQKGVLKHSNDVYSGIYDSSLDYNKQITAQCGNNWQRIGENVGRGGDSASIFNAFIASPGHKANIVGDYTHVGVGSYVASNGTLYVAQVFSKCPSCGSPYTTSPRSVGEPGTNLRDTMTGGQKLTSGQSIYSKNGSYRLVMQSDGNLVLYRHWGGAIWNSRTANSSNAYSIFQTDGNFVVYRTGKHACHSGTGGKGGKSIVLLGYGNLVIYTSSSAIWQSRTSSWYC